MEFGKLPSVDGVDFTLPEDPVTNAELLAGLGRSDAAPKVYLGATGYNMKPWVGTWYPEGTRDRDMLRWYGRQFNTIEHNTTHYRIPDAAAIARWREEVPDDFRYCPKLPQQFSHARNLGLGSAALEDFVERIRDLGPQLGCSFIQLPPYVEVRQLPQLLRFLEWWPADLPLAVEVRHPSFFEPTVASEHYFHVLEQHGVAAVITDVAGRRDVCHMRVCAAHVMVRFVGNAHSSDAGRIQDWADRLAGWFAAGLREAWFFTHAPDNLLAPELAAFARDAFRARIPGVRTRGPEPVPPPARQGTLFG